MKRLMMLLAAVSVLICAAPKGWAAPASDDAQTDQEKVRMLEERGDLAGVHNDYQRAAAYYLTALHISRENATLYNKLGVAELKMGSRGQAHKDFGRALKFDPQLVSAENNLGAVALLDKKYKSAIDYFKKALALDESVAATHVNLAEAWVGLGNMDRAMTEYARALELDADILSDSDNGAFAQISTPEQRARISFLIAKAYIKRGNVDGALEYLRRAKAGNYPKMGDVYSDQAFAPLWTDPRLQKIIKR
ncbi:MAG: tetratricopeptide repeat protein [Terracidiphilus sp.]|jgi:tetratricopeptide (TPR) repeat protein